MKPQDATVECMKDNVPPIAQQDTLPGEREHPAARPRRIPDEERGVARREKLPSQGPGRSELRARHLELDPVARRRMTTTTTGRIQRQEKRLLGERAFPARSTAKPSEILEERETVKWAAWGALLISLVALGLVAVYSGRDFGPEFAFYDLETTQKQVVENLQDLQYSSRLEKIKTAVIHAHLQLLVRRDHAAADLLLSNAKQELTALIDSLPVEKKVEPKQLLSKVERLIRDIRRGPSSLDEQVNQILSDLEEF